MDESQLNRKEEDGKEEDREIMGTAVATHMGG